MDDDEQLIQMLAEATQLKRSSVIAVVKLLDEGNTVPFITRYRKQQTDGLDETQIRAIQEQVVQLREIASERKRMLAAISEQGKLSDDLQRAFETADSKRRLTELFAPFRTTRKTKAAVALERGLGPLAEAIWSGKVGDAEIQKVARNCIGKHPELDSAETVTSGTLEIIAARIAESISVRDLVREIARQSGVVATKLVTKIKDEQDRKTFEDYAAFEGAIRRLPPHRVLAIDRGEAKKVLRVSLKWDDERSQRKSAANLAFGSHRARSFLNECLAESLKRFINPAIERELRRELTEQAHQHAIEVFGKNLRSLLMQPPLKRERILAIDPGYRTGCKIAALDENGKLLASDVIFVIGKEAEKSQQKLAELVNEHQSEVIAIGNGTASRETEQIVAKTIEKHDLQCKYTIVNEAGASIYSASDVGREEFPDLDATVRGTVSIGRRLMDPLSELVKIESQHLGVGMYQHDVPESQLNESLDVVVESCVNSVGIDLNRASAELLKYVSGFNRKIARNVVARRDEVGPFRNREELRTVSGIGEATFTQSAGFLRIHDGEDSLDATWIHPESYPVARELIKFSNAGFETASSTVSSARLQETLKTHSLDSLAERLHSDKFTIQEVIDSLLKPGRDPREELSGPLFKSGVLQFEDLSPGMKLQGVVSNVVDFGAFVDIGLKNDGLVHISKMSDSFVASPFDHTHVGDVVTVWVDELDAGRMRVSLTFLRPVSE